MYVCPCRSRAKLEINSTVLTAIAPGTYTIKVTVTNFLNVTATATRDLKVALAGITPVISIVGPTEQSFVISEGFKVSTLLVAESVCPNSEVRARRLVLNTSRREAGGRQSRILHIDALSVVRAPLLHQ